MHYAGKEEGLDFEHPYYVAHGDDIGVVTDGDVLDELLRNLREALADCLQGVDTLAEYNLRPGSHIILSMDVTELYAQTA